MAKSKAKKQREKSVREGKRSPASGRSIYAIADLRTRRTKTKQEKLQQNKHKGRSHQSYEDGGSSFYHVKCLRRSLHYRILKLAG
ncbi:hypothetical protein CGZ90_06505 [Fictibacillus aquaticus]|jgi:hypothetical protein|uniref:Uncharacterized protein n=1 Tax=Fictibacillus aquaticus TaxID=2021314 RepID=A0A235FEB6_9BACL|nr:hypothetical protein [Fictibacillus aquaticus]OYD59539.1 hypothetical protein CGZ90_06505 [Fictibacillus aquaticus]